MKSLAAATLLIAALLSASGSRAMPPQLFNPDAVLISSQVSDIRWTAHYGQLYRYARLALEALERLRHVGSAYRPE